MRSGLLIRPDEAATLAARYGTPLYLLDTSRVVSAMEGLRRGLARHYSAAEVTYSVKTNYLAAILRKVLQAGYRLEVVSRHEWELAKRAGAGPRQLLLNGPVKSLADLRDCYQQGVSVNLDSLDELTLAGEIGTPERPFAVGLRVAARLSNGTLSRFGINFEDPAQVERVRTAGPGVRVVGLHLHHSSRRDARSYGDRLDRLVEVAEQLELTPEYLDIGGGIASAPPPEVAARMSYPIDTQEEWAEYVGRYAQQKLGAGGPKLIVEPGIGVLAESMNYVTSVVSVKPGLAVCDGSMFDVNPLRSSIPPPCRLLAEDRVSEETKLYGGTCMEIDCVGTLSARPRVGDRVVVSNVGAYSACLAPEFIVPPAAVYAVDSGELVRERREAGSYVGAGR